MGRVDANAVPSVSEVQFEWSTTGRTLILPRLGRWAIHRSSSVHVP